MQKFELNRLASYSDEDILNEIRWVALLIENNVITRAEFSHYSRVSHQTLRRRFGSWRQALEAAGLPHRYNDVGVTEKQKTQAAKEMSDEDVLNEIRLVAKQLNQVGLSVEQFNQFSSINANTVRRRFGSWQAGLERAGLLVLNHGKRYSNEECFENLLRVWTHYGRPPTHREMNYPPSIVGSKAYITRWRTWNKALHAFVDQANHDLQADTKQEEKTLQTNFKSRKKTKSESEYREIKLGLRWAVFKRDNFRCILCGRSPATDLNCELHADHIIPISKGGKTVMENLRCLCKECNLGKGAKLE